MNERKKVSLWERYLTHEIGIEFKACLYFFAILFLYCIYRVSRGIWSADILHMSEMILLCYVIGYVQVYLFNNFDEAEKLKAKEICGVIMCTCAYSGLSYAFNWFDRKIGWTVGFTAYVVILYICVFLIYYTKRRIDDKKLNEELALFKSRPDKVQDTDE